MKFKSNLLNIYLIRKFTQSLKKLLIVEMAEKTFLHKAKDHYNVDRYTIRDRIKKNEYF